MWKWTVHKKSAGADNALKYRLDLWECKHEAERILSNREFSGFWVGEYIGLTFHTFDDFLDWIESQDE